MLVNSIDDLLGFLRADAFHMMSMRSDIEIRSAGRLMSLYKLVPRHEVILGIDVG